ncbi:MMPL family transporter [Kineosporia sp. J2-2]|uniref:MMPL family transporter n=1 Tax=Kineosporia corallincola TaxID=2835133 RepID=A0ABS5TKM4_9ACTN|nr:MMPL family transporter [Kineosporia corallincola]MBT0771650.1 MMPL family transporter [Kineosporia corallincola]
MSRVFRGLGHLVSRRPWWVLGAWVLFAVVVVTTAPTVTATTDQADFLPGTYESIKGYELIDQAFPQTQQAGATIVFDRSDGAPLSEQDLSTIATIAEGLRPGSAFGTVGEVTPSPSNQAAIVNIGLAPGVTGQDPADLDQVPDLRDQVGRAVEGTGLDEGVTGALAQGYDQTESGQNAEAIVFVATIALIVVLLGAIFRSVLIAFMPLVLVGIVSAVAGGLIAMVEKAFDLNHDPSTSVILIVVLFGIGTDYILFFLFRYREARRDGEVHRQAVSLSIERAGEAIASAGGAVFVAFMTLVLSSLGIFRSIGPSLAVAVAVTLLAALTLVPATVTVLGRALFWPSKKWREQPRGSRFAGVGASLGRHPVRYAAVSGAFLVVLSVFALSFNPTFDLGDSNSASDVESATATATMEQKGFSAGATDPTPIVLHAGDGRALTEAEVKTFSDAVAGTEGIGQVVSATVSPDDPSTALVMTILKYDSASGEALAAVKDDLRPAADAAAPQGTEAYVAGTAGVFVDFQAAMNRDYSVVFPVAAAIILLILMVLLRSLVAPWYLMVSVGLGFAATLGATVIVFQQIKGDPGLIFLLPIYIYLFVVALGTDYNILMVARLREEARAGRDPREAAAQAVRHAGPTIAAAGVILAGTFASLMLAGNSLLLTMGFAVSFGIVIAAFVMAMFFTPALTALFGHAAWWPGHSDAVVPVTDENPHLPVTSGTPSADPHDTDPHRSDDAVSEP